MQIFELNLHLFRPRQVKVPRTNHFDIFYKPYNFERSCGLYFTASYRLHINHCLLSFIEFVGLFHYWKIWTTLSYINIIANYCCEKKQVKETLRLKLQHGRMLWHPLGGEETWSNNSLQKPGGG